MNFCVYNVSFYSKIAPQNIMYDRRVVRGNTFAALVIPVSKSYFTFLKRWLDMQPDPSYIEKQKHDHMVKLQHNESMRKRREDDQRRMQMMQQEE